MDGLWLLSMLFILFYVVIGVACGANRDITRNHAGEDEFIFDLKYLS